MIVVDTSSPMAILLGEPEGAFCMDAIEAANTLAFSAGTVAEALIVAERRNLGREMHRLFDGLGFDIQGVTPARARQVAEAYGRWGKGVHRPGLNLGDCFAYALAREHDAPLLYVGDDFSRTDARLVRQDVS